MTKIHKDIAMRLMEVVNDEEYSDQQVVKVGLINETVHSYLNVIFLASVPYFYSLHLTLRSLPPRPRNC